MTHRFVIVDVFTETPFGGNQLAVLPDARGLSDRAMQTLAREFNFAETTFVLPPDDPRHTYRLRIFTPAAEVPFAGHPTVGTAAALARLGLIEVPDGRATIVFEEGVGPVEVEIELDGDRTTARLIIHAQVEMPTPAPTHAAAAAALGLREEAVRDAWYAGVGVPFCFVHLAGTQQVDRAALDHAAWTAHFKDAPSPDLFMFAGETAPGSTLYARMFAPAFGITEDPATGSASAALVGTLSNRVAATEGSFAWHIDQGVAMGRPSKIEGTSEKQDGRTTTITISGSSVMVAEGTISVPAGY